MNLPELNALLLPYNISLECDACDDCEPMQAPPHRPVGRGRRVSDTPKKISKRTARIFAKHFSEKKGGEAQEDEPTRRTVRSFSATLQDEDLAEPDRCDTLSIFGILEDDRDLFFEDFKPESVIEPVIPQFDAEEVFSELKSCDYEHDTALSSLQLVESVRGLDERPMEVTKMDLFAAIDCPIGDLGGCFSFEADENFEAGLRRGIGLSELFRFG